MVEEILPGIFQLQIPLPGNPLKNLNSYLIKGTQRHLLVDTGFNWAECREAQLKAMAQLGVDWSSIDFYITHAHGDHSGLVYSLAGKESKVYCSQTEAHIIQDCMAYPFWNELNAAYITNGFPAEMLTDQVANITSFIGGSDLNFTYIKDGDVIEAGSYQLICTSTPGHSPGHMCLYEPEHKFLIGGDHILSHISSNITNWNGVSDSLGQYLSSLERVDAMDIRLVLPGHRELIRDYHGRIAELKHHHKQRLEEILGILQTRAMTAYQVAGHIHWDLSYDSWEEFPSYQKWFATGETIAHLEYLAQRNKVLGTQQGQQQVYALPGRKEQAV